MTASGAFLLPLLVLIPTSRLRRFDVPLAMRRAKLDFDDVVAPSSCCSSRKSPFLYCFMNFTTRPSGTLHLRFSSSNCFRTSLAAVLSFCNEMRVSAIRILPQRNRFRADTYFFQDIRDSINYFCPGRLVISRRSLFHPLVDAQGVDLVDLNLSRCDIIVRHAVRDSVVQIKQIASTKEATLKLHDRFSYLNLCFYAKMAHLVR